MRLERSGIIWRCLAISLLVAGCATRGEDARVTTARVTTAPLRAMRREDTLWLERASFGLDSASVESYRQLGRERFLERQLHPGEDAVPGPIAAGIGALGITRADPAKWLARFHAQCTPIYDMPD